MSARNSELASFLKSRRQRLTPNEVGLPQTNRRRVASLRREEVAWLADVGITWYTWLEQGRPIKIAEDTLGRIAVALRLDSSETEYLQKLVHGTRRQRRPWDTPASDLTRGLIEVYSAGPAFVVGPRWDVLACNDYFTKFFVFNESERGLERNALWSMFTAARTHVVFPKWSELARQMVAVFRVEYADFVGDEGFEQLIQSLSLISPEFVAIWSDVDVLSPVLWNVRELRDIETRAIRRFETVNFHVPEATGQTAIFLYPADKGGTASH